MACVLGVGGPVAAQQRMGLDEVMAYAIEHAPSLAIAQQQVAVSDALLQQASGAFDSVLGVSVTASHAQGELLPGVARSQQGNRDTFRILSEEFDEIADDLERQLEQNPAGAGVDCVGDTQIIIDGVDICEDEATRRGRAIFADLLDLLIETEVDPEQREALEELRVDNIANNRNTIRGVIADLRFQAEAARESLIRLGGIPPVEIENSLLVDVGYTLNWRNGQTLRPQFLIEALDDIFRNKERQGGLGGKGEPRTFRAAFGATWTVPLGRGGGLAAAATERSADESLQARRFQAIFSAAILARDITTAYWRLAATEERLELQRRQVDRQQRLADLSEALAEAGEVPAADTTLARAGTRQAASALIGLRTQWRDQRLQLAVLMGLPVESLDEAPVPATGLPILTSEACSIDGAALVDGALARRDDLAAFERLLAAEEELLAAADYDRRPRIDFTMTVAFSTLEEGGPLILGLDRAIFGDYSGPSVFLGLSGELPQFNASALGTYRRRVASVSQAETRWIESQRSIRTAVLDAAAAVERAAREWGWRRQSVAAFRDLVEADRLRLQDARATVIDVLVAQEQLQAALLAELAAREAFWVAVARLRHELDVLLVVDPATGEPLVLDGATRSPCDAAEPFFPGEPPYQVPDNPAPEGTMRQSDGR